jgi:MFS family permease
MTGAFLIPFGHLADICPILSRKYILILSLTAFSLIVAFTSFSSTGVVVDIMSGLAGLACAAIIPTAVGILSLVYPEPSRRKNIVFSSFLMGNPVATIVGGLGTGGVASAFNWKATFIFLGILYAFVTILSWWIVPNVSESRSMRQAEHFDGVSPFVSVSKEAPDLRLVLQKFDWMGLFLLLTGVLMFTVALTIGPEGPQPWKTPTVILLLTLGLLCIGSFVMWESSTRAPMIPPAI